MEDKLQELLIKHEGLCLFPYPDPLHPDIITIGIGRNLTDRGITEDEALILLEHDIHEAREDLYSIFPDDELRWSENRLNALIDMMFNLGKTKFLEFKHMIESIRLDDWTSASDAMRNSLWAEQAPSRVSELATMVENG